MSDFDNFIPQLTLDGSFTFFSTDFHESFHSHYGARQESFLKFVSPTQLVLKANKPVLRLLDVCYGLGYNTAAALQTIWATNPNCYVEVIGLEVNAAIPQAAIAHNLFNNWDYQHTQILTQLAFSLKVLHENIDATLLIGDARSSIQFLHNLGNGNFDAIFLDPFSPPQCPQLWTIEFIQLLSLLLDESGILATYSCAAAVRTALLAAGLQIGSTPPVGRRSPGTVATYGRDRGDRGDGGDRGDRGVISLSQAEKEHLLTRAAVPYRDPELNDSSHIIIKRREQEQQVCAKEPTSVWRKRWLKKGVGYRG